MTKAQLLEENTRLRKEVETIRNREIVLDDMITRSITIKYGEDSDQELLISLSTIWLGNTQKKVIRLQSQDMLGMVGNAQNSFYIATHKKITL